ncbi:hypothetical protein [uncultured Ruminococcus sp.]|uniref:hypothetical protein n=1 Tax=uncultured Ruminococcus sp. TaxID=165186 RepID=UPI0025F56279|nr:hypothetical protein [uncultured Ruminococcus sp.]
MSIVQGTRPCGWAGGQSPQRREPPTRKRSFTKQISGTHIPRMACGARLFRRDTRRPNEISA